MTAKPIDNVQIIKQDGRPVFVVLPYEDWLELTGQEDHAYLPHEVVGYMVKEDFSLLAAWRKHRGLTQAELAERIGSSQSSLQRMERSGARLRKATLEKLADALDVTVEQLKG